jgi:hypothetical protein
VNIGMYMSMYVYMYVLISTEHECTVVKFRVSVATLQIQRYMFSNEVHVASSMENRLRLSEVRVREF